MEASISLVAIKSVSLAIVSKVTLGTSRDLVVIQGQFITTPNQLVQLQLEIVFWVFPVQTGMVMRQKQIVR